MSGRKVKSALRGAGLAAITLVLSAGAACGENGDAAEEEAAYEKFIEIMRAQGATEEEVAAYRKAQVNATSAVAEEEKVSKQTSAEQAEKNGRGVSEPSAKRRAAGAAVVFEGETYALKPYGVCLAGADGAYNIWFVTPDENEPDVAKEGAPRLHAFSNGEWSRLEFYVGGSKAAGIYRERGEGIAFSDGRLFYEGPVDGDSGQPISIEAQC